MAKKTIEEQYKEMDEVSHILLRPGMYVGSVKEEETNLFVYSKSANKMAMKEITYIPAMLKIVDEIISNSCDEYRRSTNLGLNKIDVHISQKNGCVVVKDNGGIPVVIHKEAKCYLPEFIFGRLRTSSNYDDTEDRSVIGVNGVGSALANVFSKSFEVTTADKKKTITVKWKNNMKECVDHGKPENCKDHFTQTTFYIDFEKFDTKDKTFTKDFVDVVHKRCIDAAAANPGLKVTFKTDEYFEDWQFKEFSEYMDLFGDFISPKTGIEFQDGNIHAWVFPDGNLNVGFVNGAECSKGTHFKAVRNIINNSISEYIKKKEKIEVTSKGIDNKYSMFCNVTVSNPSYSSQTKEELVTPIDRFTQAGGYAPNIPDKFLDKVNKSEIVKIVLDWYKQKVAAEDAKAIRQLNRQASKGLKRPDKYIECSSKKKNERQLWIFEGDSANAGFRSGRISDIQAGYLMRGVPKNVYGMTPVQIMKNEVFNDIVTVLGLKWGNEFDIKDLNFGKIVISSDADVDGDKICALLLNFFNNWPELFEKNIICRSVSPIIIASKGKDVRKYYNMEQYNEEAKKLKGYTIKYTKGLAGLSNKESKEMYHEPIFHYYKKDEMADSMLRKWFSKDDSDVRKTMLSE